jgi:integrase
VRDSLDAYFKACRSAGLKESTLNEYLWRISYVDWHLGDLLITDLTREHVIEFRDGRLDAGLSTKSVNSFVQTLAAALEEEVEIGNLQRNVARGRGRTVKLVNKALSRPFMDYDQVDAILDAADEIEKAAREQYRTGRRYLIAAIWFGGLRVTEACCLTWGDWDQIAGTLRIGESKTDAGIREVVVLRRLHEEMTEWKAKCPNTRHDAPMFPNANGGHRDRSNVSNRVINKRLRTEAERIYRERHGEDRRPLPDGVTAHDGRRTYAAWALEAGHNPAWEQRQLGHTDPSMTLRVYARTSDRAPDPRIEDAMKRR